MQTGQLLGITLEKWRENSQFMSMLYADVILEICLLSCVRNMVGRRKTKKKVVFFTVVELRHIYNTQCCPHYLICNSALLMSLCLALKSFLFSSLGLVLWVLLVRVNDVATDLTAALAEWLKLLYGEA